MSGLMRAHLNRLLLLLFLLLSLINQLETYSSAFEPPFPPPPTHPPTYLDRIIREPNEVQHHLHEKADNGHIHGKGDEVGEEGAVGSSLHIPCFGCDGIFLVQHPPFKRLCIERVGRWVVEKIEEIEAVGMSYCGLEEGGWVGGWVTDLGGVLSLPPFQENSAPQSQGDVEERHPLRILSACWRGGWVGGWVGG